jgi:hypothetical protein
VQAMETAINPIIKYLLCMMLILAQSIQNLNALQNHLNGSAYSRYKKFTDLHP